MAEYGLINMTKPDKYVEAGAANTKESGSWFIIPLSISTQILICKQHIEMAYLLIKTWVHYFDIDGLFAGDALYLL